MSEVDGLCRCPWVGSDALYIRYHDEEWGVPKTRDLDFFEKLILEGFQSGLSWLTILRKRDGFRRAFDGFDPEKVARFDEAKVAALLADAGIVRHRGKIEAAIANARAYLDLRQSQTLAAFFWGFVNGEAIQNRFASLSEIPPRDAAERRHRQAFESARFSLLRPHHDLFADAGMRTRE